MHATSTFTPREDPPIRSSRLWAGVLVAPTAWSVAELLGYVLASRACDRGAAGAVYAGLTQDVLAVALGVIAVVGLTIAVANWHRVREPPGLDRSQIWGRAHFMALAGTVSSGLFVLGIVLFTLPPLLLNPCEHVR
jgi:hypothetical protein